ncbi:MAG: PAS domain-containing sensor histidine kinase [bacterium]
MDDIALTAYRMKKLIRAIKGYIYTVKVENGVAVETHHGEGCAEITGYTTEDHRADRDLWVKMVCKEDRMAVLAHVEQALAGEEQPPLEHRIIHRDGSLRWIKSTIALNKDEYGRLLSYDGLITNISVRKSGEEALRESEQRYKRLLGSVTDYIYSVRIENGRALTTTHGPGCVAVTGYTAEEFDADSSLWYRMVHEEDRQTVIARVNGAMQGETVPGLEHRIIHKDGSVRWVKNFIVLRKDANGVVVSYDGLVRNITSRKKAEELAEIRRQQLRQADNLASLGILVAGVAHEINNPNNYILLNAKLLSRGWREIKPILDEYAASNGDFILAGLGYAQMYDKITQLFGGLIDGSKRIQKIVHSLTTFARDGGVGAKELFDANAVLTNAVTIVDTLIKKSTDNFSAHFAPNLPLLRGNAQQLEQVLINLITNSCQALQHREAYLRLETAHDAEHDNVIIRVMDGGNGIRESDLKRIFDPFFTTKREIGGTGLGLSISYKIIKDQGGDLSFTSQAGNGTTATVKLPAAKRVA